MDEFLVELAELATHPRPRSEVGGKAWYLARLLAAGLPVPAGLVVTTGVAGLPADDRDEILDQLPDALLVRLGARVAHSRFAVRSSARLEDDVAAAAPGVFASLLHVQPEDLADAVRRVWASARTKLARAYARLRGVEDLTVAVIVQGQVPPQVSAATAAGTLYTRWPGGDPSGPMRLEIRFRGDRPIGAPESDERISLTLERDLMGPPDADSRPTDWPLPEPLVHRLARLALAAERAIDAPAGADVEWVRHGDELWIVQARPIAVPAARPDPTPGLPPVMLAFSRLEPERLWRWDVTHNPEPLSAAQTGLVERVDAAGLAPYRSRVVGGYLYTASDNRSSGSGANDPDAAAGPSEDPGVPVFADADALRAHVEGELMPALRRALAPIDEFLAPDGSGRAPELPVVLDAYEDFYRIYASRLAPALSRGKRALAAFLSQYLGPEGESLAGRLAVLDRPLGIDADITLAARGQLSFTELLARVGTMAPAWDVACPTFAETPELLRQAVARHAHRLQSADPEPAPSTVLGSPEVQIPDAIPAPRLARHIALTKTARALSELDDRLFARAQAGVRHALLGLARRWHLEPVDDIFAVPLATILSWYEHGHPPEPARIQRMAQAGRAAQERQRAWHPPLSFANGIPVSRPHRTGRDDSFVGRGFGSRVQGRAIRVERLDALSSGAAQDASGAIVVTAAVTPAMAVWMRGALALVAEFGGLLDHGAAMARELGIPCVVGCTGAWSHIQTGEALWVDGDAGMVIKTRAD